MRWYQQICRVLCSDVPMMSIERNSEWAQWINPYQSLSAVCIMWNVSPVPPLPTSFLFSQNMANHTNHERHTSTCIHARSHTSWIYWNRKKNREKNTHREIKEYKMSAAAGDGKRWDISEISYRSKCGCTKLKWFLLETYLHLSIHTYVPTAYRIYKYRDINIWPSPNPNPISKHFNWIEAKWMKCWTKQNPNIL